MSNFLRTVLVQNRAEAADRVFQEQLPVNPISMILVTLRGVITAADTNNPLSDIFGMVTTMGMSFRGQDIFRGTLADLAVLNSIVCQAAPWGVFPNAAAGNTFSLTVPLCLGRRPYLVGECFPAVRRGDLTLDLTVDTVTNNVDLQEVQIETVELLDETPKQYIKYTTGAVTFSSTGDQDVRLPIGNPLLGVLLQGATVPAGVVQTATWERLRLRVDNVEALYARANWASLNGEMGRLIKTPSEWLNAHVHRFNGAAAAFANTLEPSRPAGILEQYAFLDFDPLDDGSFALETVGRADVVIHRDAGTADAGRFIPVELVAVAGQGS
jgi:hypothetical protein